MVYGALIVENRTPILPCLDWVQRVCGLYGSGALEAENFTEDFTTFSVGIHTGANVQLTDSFGIGADISLINFGSITYKSDNGSEFKEDIGDATINKQMPVKLAFRFSF
jgi:hypothetical protein